MQWQINHTIQLTVIDITPLTVSSCNCPLLKEISFNTKCLLVWCDKPVITCLVWAGLGINPPQEFWKCSHFTGVISRFSKMHSGNLSQIVLSYFPYFNVICCFISQRFFKALPKNYHQVYYHCNTRVILFYEIRVEQTRWKWTSSLTISNQTPISYSINVSRLSISNISNYISLNYQKRPLLLTGELRVKKSKWYVWTFFPPGIFTLWSASSEKSVPMAYS